MLQPIKYSFNGGNISTDAGAITIRSFIKQIRLPEKVDEVFEEAYEPSRRGAKRQYTRADTIVDMIQGYMKGYANPTEMSRTKGDPVFSFLEERAIGSQSTLSRTNTSFTEEDIKKFKLLLKQILQNYFEELVRKNGGKKLQSIDISDDSTREAEFHGQARG